MADSAGRARQPRSATAGEPHGPTDARHSVSVDRGFAILERFSGERESESIAEIAAAVDLPRSSVHRYLQTLSVLGLVEQRGMPRRRYRLTATAGSPGIAALGATGLRSVAHAELVSMRRASGCTVRLAVRIGPDALLVDQAPSFEPGQSQLALQTRPGARVPGGARSALRQALELCRSDDQRTVLRRDASAENGTYAMPEQGIAIEEGLLAAGTCALAVPVCHPHTGESIAAVDLLGMAPQITLRRLEAKVAELQALATRLAPAIADLPWTRWQPYKRRLRA